MTDFKIGEVIWSAYYFGFPLFRVKKINKVNSEIEFIRDRVINVDKIRTNDSRLCNRLLIHNFGPMDDEQFLKLYYRYRFELEAARKKTELLSKAFSRIARQNIIAAAKGDA